MKVAPNDGRFPIGRILHALIVFYLAFGIVARRFQVKSKPDLRAAALSRPPKLFDGMALRPWVSIEKYAPCRHERPRSERWTSKVASGAATVRARERI